MTTQKESQLNAWAMKKQIQKFRGTGSIHEKPRSLHLSNVHYPQISTGVLAAVVNSPQRSLRLVIEQGVLRILYKNK